MKAVLLQKDLKKLLTPDEDGDWSLDSARLAPLMEQLTGATLTEELSKAVQPIAAKAFFGVVQQAGHEGTAVSWQWAWMEMYRTNLGAVIATIASRL